MRQLETSLKHLEPLTLRAEHWLSGGAPIRWVGGTQPKIDPEDLRNVCEAARQKQTYEASDRYLSEQLTLAESLIRQFHTSLPKDTEVPLSYDQRELLINLLAPECYD